MNVAYKPFSFLDAAQSSKEQWRGLAALCMIQKIECCRHLCSADLIWQLPQPAPAKKGSGKSKNKEEMI